MEFLESSYKTLDELFKILVQYAGLILEGMGVCIIITTAFRCIIGTIRHKKDNLRLKLAEGIAYALEFKLGSEVLRTVLARDLGELAIIAAVIALRALLTFLLHWEIKNEQQRPELLNFIDKDHSETKKA